VLALGITTGSELAADASAVRSWGVEVTGSARARLR